MFDLPRHVSIFSLSPQPQQNLDTTVLLRDDPFRRLCPTGARFSSIKSLCAFRSTPFALSFAVEGGTPILPPSSLRNIYMNGKRGGGGEVERRKEGGGTAVARTTMEISMQMCR